MMGTAGVGGKNGCERLAARARDARGRSLRRKAMEEVGDKAWERENK